MTNNTIPSTPTSPPIPEASKDDKREAVKIGVNLSNQLITTSLGLIAVVGAVVTFIMQQRIVDSWFYSCATISFFSLLASIFCGGKGINKSRNSGSKGDWATSVGKKWFNRQAILTFLGVFSLTILLFTGGSKESELEKSQVETNKLLNKQIEQTNQLFQKVTKDQDEKIYQLSIKVDALADSLQTLTKKRNTNSASK